MGIEVTGKLHTIFETKQVSERFTKREFVVEIADNPKYPQVVLFQVTGDRCSQLDGLQVGDEVRIEFSLRGREWRSPKGEVKYFNSLDASCSVVMCTGSFVPRIQVPAHNNDLLRLFGSDDLSRNICRRHIGEGLDRCRNRHRDRIMFFSTPDPISTPIAIPIPRPGVAPLEAFEM